MKKIIVSIIALTFVVGAFAKPLDQLVAEMPKSHSTRAELDARKQYTEDNKDDFIRELKIYMASDIAKKPMSELSEKEQSIRRTFAPIYSMIGTEVNVPEIVGLRISVGRYFDIYGVEAYEKIKSANWKLDGFSLTQSEINTLAFRANDVEYILSCDVKTWSAYGLKLWAKNVKNILVNYPDAQKAKKFCRNYQSAMLSRGVSGSSNEYKEMQTVEEFLNRGILFK